MKVCSKCKKELDESMFSKNKLGKNGLKSYCKECNNKMVREYFKTTNGLIAKIYGRQKNSSKKRDHKPPQYTKQQLHYWMISDDKFIELYNNWASNGYKKTDVPSVDRIDDSKGYSLDNIQIMTWSDNDNKAHKKYVGTNHQNSKNKEHFISNSTTRSNFKIICGRQGWNYEDFEEVYSGEKQYSNKKYYYILKG